jgi:hypothetical protein
MSENSVDSNDPFFLLIYGFVLRVPYQALVLEMDLSSPCDFQNHEPVGLLTFVTVPAIEILLFALVERAEVYWSICDVGIASNDVLV